MRRVTESDIQEMRASGYEHATIREAEEALGRTKVADQLIAQIAEAFSGVVLGDGVGLRHAQGLDDYEDEATCARYREADEKEDWQAITSSDLNSCNSSLSFFDPEGMRFHLPAYMSAELRGEYNCGMAFSLTQVGDYERYYSSLDLIQRQAVSKRPVRCLICKSRFRGILGAWNHLRQSYASIRRSRIAKVAGYAVRMSGRKYWSATTRAA